MLMSDETATNEAPVEVPDAVREYMRAIATKRTPQRAAASRANAEKAREARRRDPMTLPCICDGGASLEASAHVWTCPRGRLLKQREKAAQQRAAKIEAEATST